MAAVRNVAAGRCCWRIQSRNFLEKKSNFVISKIGPKSLRSEGPLIKAHSPHEPKLTKDERTSCAQLMPGYMGLVRADSRGNLFQEQEYLESSMMGSGALDMEFKPPLGFPSIP